MTAPVRTAREVVELYNLVVWNQRDFALADELLADEVTRHGVEEVVTLTREQARQRVERLCASAAPADQAEAERVLAEVRELIVSRHRGS